MEKPRLFISRELFPEVIEELEKFYEVEVWDKYHGPSYEYLVEKLRSVDAYVSMVTDRIDCGLLQVARRLRIIAQYGVGLDNIDVVCATRLGIYVTNTPNVLAESVAELTWSLILAVSRRIVEADHFVRWGEWYRTRTSVHPLMMLGTELKGKMLGIIGLGSVGRRVAEIGKAFGMRVIYYSRSRKPDVESSLGIEYRSFDDVVSEADVLTIHVPLTSETRHLINEDVLRRMKKNAILINTSRGPVVDTEALVKALREGWIAGAGLDVFENEPLQPNHPLTAFKNVVLLPHLGSATREARLAMARLVAENLIAFYKGQVPPTLVNSEVVKHRRPGFD